VLRAGRVLVGCSGVGALSRPRTLVAWNAGRTRLWLVTVNGRGSASPVSRYGATYRQVADAVRSLGATDAVMVDGGGSTTMALRGGDGRVRRVDAPAGTPQRPVPDGLVLIRR
jgi:exopolysaccharide biosynthesis protein